MLELLNAPGERLIYEPAGDPEEAFERAVRLYLSAKVERDGAGNIIIIAPGSLESCDCELEVGSQLAVWNREQRLGHVFSPSAVFRLPNGAKRSADASWMSNEQWDKLNKGQRQGFRGVAVPEFVIEVKSPSDRLPELVERCREWTGQGVKDAWLVDPYQRRTTIFRSGMPEVEDTSDEVAGPEFLPGFRLTLRPVWDVAAL